MFYVRSGHRSVDCSALNTEATGRNNLHSLAVVYSSNFHMQFFKHASISIFPIFCQISFPFRTEHTEFKCFLALFEEIWRHCFGKGLQNKIKQQSQSKPTGMLLLTCWKHWQSKHVVWTFFELRRGFQRAVLPTAAHHSMCGWAPPGISLVSCK